MMSLPAAKVIKKNRQLQDYPQSANRLVPQMEQSFPWYFVMQDTHIYEGAWLWKYRGLESYIHGTLKIQLFLRMKHLEVEA